MNEELTTISQIAKELKVSRQTVYNRINNNPDLSSKLCQCTVKIQNRTFYTLQAIDLIKQDFEKNVKSSIDVKFTSNMIDTLTQQLTVKDNQIAALQSEVATLTDTVKELTIALKAAQALHGMDKQQKTIDVRAAAAPTEKKKSKQASREPQPKPRPKKTWLDKLLRR